VAGTSLDDLVAVTGLGRGSLYGAFSNKHTIFLRALDEYSNMTMAAVRAELRDSAESAYDRLVSPHPQHGASQRHRFQAVRLPDG